MCIEVSYKIHDSRSPNDSQTSCKIQSLFWEAEDLRPYCILISVCQVRAWKAIRESTVVYLISNIAVRALS